MPNYENAVRLMASLHQAQLDMKTGYDCRVKAVAMAVAACRPLDQARIAMLIPALAEGILQTCRAALEILGREDLLQKFIDCLGAEPGCASAPTSFRRRYNEDLELVHGNTGKLADLEAGAHYRLRHTHEDRLSTIEFKSQHGTRFLHRHINALDRLCDAVVRESGLIFPPSERFDAGDTVLAFAAELRLTEAQVTQYIGTSPEDLSWLAPEPGISGSYRSA